MGIAFSALMWVFTCRKTPWLELPRQFAAVGLHCIMKHRTCKDIDLIMLKSIMLKLHNLSGRQVVYIVDKVVGETVVNK